MGMNMMLVRTGERYVIIDCGLQFADAARIGVECAFPNLDLLRGLQGKVDAILLTHGHEDHIGALRWVLPVLDVPVYGTAFTLALVRRRLKENGLLEKADLRLIAPGQSIDVGLYRAHFFRVTHSIPDCVTVALETPAGILVHSGDFKIDPEPLDGEAFDHEGLRALGDRGVRLLLSDSTNASVPGHTRSEAAVARGLSEAITPWPGRVLVALFSSNLYRLSSLWRIARASGRKLCVVGRSMERYLEVGREHTRIALPGPGDLLDLNGVAALPADQVLIACTGSQAEGRSALVRASFGDHKALSVGQGDLVVFSSRLIPGNEVAVHRLMNRLARRGAQIIEGRRAPVHASGHARQDELRTLIEHLRPRSFVPVHGEYTFLRDHIEIAQAAGVEETLLIENGQVLDVGPERAEVHAAVDAAPWFFDGGATGDAASIRLSEKIRLAWHGAVSADVTLDGGPGGRTAEVRLASAGIHVGAGSYLEDLADEVARGLEALDPSLDDDAVADQVRVLVRRAVKHRQSKKPTVFVNLHRAG